MTKALRILIFGVAGCVCADNRIRKEVLFLCDLSESAAGAEDYMRIVIGRTLVSAPGGIRFRIIPMHQNTRNAKVITQGELPETASQSQARVDRSKLGRQAIRSLHDALQVKGRHRNQSCLVDALARISDFAGTTERENIQLSAVFLSDMVEDCGVLPPVRGKTAAEAVLVQRFGREYRKFVRLNSTKVLICVLTSSPLGTSSDRSGIGNWSLAEQREFWQGIFTGVGLKSSALYEADATDCARAVWQ